MVHRQVCNTVGLEPVLSSKRGSEHCTKSVLDDIGRSVARCQLFKMCDVLDSWYEPL